MIEPLARWKLPGAPPAWWIAYQSRLRPTAETAISELRELGLEPHYSCPPSGLGLWVSDRTHAMLFKNKKAYHLTMYTSRGELIRGAAFPSEYDEDLEEQAQELPKIIQRSAFKSAEHAQTTQAKPQFTLF